MSPKHFPEVINVAYQQAKGDGSKDIVSLKALSRIYNSQNKPAMGDGIWVVEREKDVSVQLEKLNNTIDNENWKSKTDTISVRPIHF